MESYELCLAYWMHCMKNDRMKKHQSSCIACALRKRIVHADAAVQTDPSSISETDHDTRVIELSVPVIMTEGRSLYNITAIREVCPMLVEGVVGDWLSPDADSALYPLLRADHAPFFCKWIRAESSYGLGGKDDMMMRRTRHRLYIFHFHRPTVAIENLPSK